MLPQSSASLTIASHSLGTVADAKRCTLQAESGALYLDCIASPETLLLGHDLPTESQVEQADFLALLDGVADGYRCIAALAGSKAALTAVQGSTIKVVDAAKGEPETIPADVTLVADERDSLGRTGQWCASALWWRRPDFILLGEALAAGRAFGAILALRPAGEVRCDVDPTTQARVAGVIRAVTERHLLSAGPELSRYLLERMNATHQVCPEIAAVESGPLMVRVRFTAPGKARQVMGQLCARGVLAGLDPFGRLIFAPLLPTRPAEIDVMSGSLRAALWNLPLTRQGGCCPGCDPTFPQAAN